MTVRNLISADFWDDAKNWVVLEFLEDDSKLKEFLEDFLSTKWKVPKYLPLVQKSKEKFGIDFKEILLPAFDELVGEAINPEDNQAKHIFKILQIHSDISPKVTQLVKYAFYNWSANNFGKLISFYPNQLFTLPDPVSLQPVSYPNTNIFLIVYESKIDQKYFETYKKSILHDLTTSEPSNRKRAQYLLIEKLVKPDPESKPHAGKLQVIYETLEETQGHIVRQIFPILTKLLAILPFELIQPAFDRIFHHDNHRIILDGVELTLQLESKDLPLPLVKSLFYTMRQQFVYADIKSEMSWTGDLPKNCLNLMKFCENYHKDFPFEIIKSTLIEDITGWSGIAMYYLSRGLLKLKVPEKKYEMTRNELHVFKVKCLTHLDLIARLRVEENLLNLALNWFDLNSVFKNEELYEYLGSTFPGSSLEPYLEILKLDVDKIQVIAETYPITENLASFIKNTGLKLTNVDRFVAKFHEIAVKSYCSEETFIRTLDDLYYLQKFDLCNFNLDGTTFLFTHFHAGLNDVSLFKKFSSLPIKFTSFPKSTTSFDDIRLSRIDKSHIFTHDLITKSSQFDKLSWRTIFTWVKEKFGVENDMDMLSTLEDLLILFTSEKRPDFETCLNAILQNTEDMPLFWKTWLGNFNLRDIFLSRLSSFEIIEAYNQFKASTKPYLAETVIEYVAQNLGKNLETDDMFIKELFLNYIQTQHLPGGRKDLVMLQTCQNICTHGYDLDRSPINVPFTYSWARITTLCVLSLAEHYPTAELLEILLDLDLNVVIPENDLGKRRYHKNSRIHRTKHKIWLTIFLLLRNEKLVESLSVDLVEQLFQTMEYSQDSSVKILQEWIFVLLLNNEKFKFGGLVFEKIDASLSNPNLPKGDANTAASYRVEV